MKMICKTGAIDEINGGNQEIDSLYLNKWGTYEERRVIRDVVTENYEAVLIVVNTELHVWINSKVLTQGIKY